MAQSANRMGTEPIVQTALRKYIFVTGTQKMHKSRYQSFSACLDLFFFPKYFAEGFLYKQTLTYKSQQSPLIFNIFTFFCNLKVSIQIPQQKEKQPNSGKVPNLNVLCKYYLACWIKAKH